LTIESLHRLIDAQNVAFADRNKYLADADFVDVPLKGLLDKEYMRHRRSKFSHPFDAVETPIPPGVPENVRTNFSISKEDLEHGTTHWSVVDKLGNAVSFTCNFSLSVPPHSLWQMLNLTFFFIFPFPCLATIEQNLGSAFVVPNRGFLLNNELTDFESFESDEEGNFFANAAEGGKKPRRTALGADSETLGGKRPRSSMTPTIIFNSTNEALYLLTGSPGGSSITGAVLNVIINTMDFHMDLQVATDYPRTLGKNGETSAERGIYEVEDGGLVQGLAARGFQFTSAVPTTATYGRVISILVGEDSFFYGASDPTREPQSLAEGF